MKKILCILSTAVLFIISGCGVSPSGDDSNEMVLQYSLGVKLTGFDPADVRDVYSLIVSSQIFESLYQYHYLKRPYALEPLLAEERPQISDDKLTYTIKIKSGVFFQDDACFEGGEGRELKAEDFIYSIKRVANIKNLSQNWSLFDGRIVGLDEFREYTKGCKSRSDVDYSRQVEGLQSPEDYTLVIKLKRPWPQFVVAVLADRVTAPVAKEAVDYYGRDIISHPVGTGPFKLKHWRRGSYIELVRNETFRGEAYPSEGQIGDAESGYLDDAGKAMPFADRIVWTIIEESQPRWFLFLQGKIDAMSIPKDNWGEAITAERELTPKMKQLEIHLKTFCDPSTFWVGFNMADEVLGGNKPLRRAISYAIDREKFIELFTNNRDEVAHGFIPALMDSYDPNIKEKGYGCYDAEKSRGLLREAEKIYGGELPVLKIAMPGTGMFARQYGQFLDHHLRAVGLEVEIEYMDWPTYQEKVNTASVQMFCSGVVASIPDAEDFLGMFYSKNRFGGSNKFNYSNPEFDRLYKKASVMFGGSERRRLYREMELIVLEDCCAAFLNHRVAYALHHDWYKNYKPHVFAYGIGKYRRIDMKKRAGYRGLLKKVR